MSPASKKVKVPATPSGDSQKVSEMAVAAPPEMLKSSPDLLRKEPATPSGDSQRVSAMAVAAPPEMLKSSPDLLRKEPAKRRSCSPDSSPTKQARTQEFRTDKVIIGILNGVCDPDLHSFYLMVYYIYTDMAYIFSVFLLLSTIGVWIPIQILKYGSSLCFGILILISKMCLTIVLLCYICAGRVFLRVV